MRKNVECIRCGHGFYTFEIETFEEFLHEIAPRFVDTKDAFLWRGSRDPSWTLNSTIARRLIHLQMEPSERNKTSTKATIDHIITFIENLRGLNLLETDHHAIYDRLRTFSKQPPDTFLWVLAHLTESQRRTIYELLSFGQHYGLATPFLDWSRTPLVALFFAFEEAGTVPSGVGRRVVYAINKTYIESIVDFHTSSPSPDDIVFLESMSHDNPRVVGQAGCFTYIPAHSPIEDWVVRRVPKNERHPVLIRFLIRNIDRNRCLAYLATMNIDSRTLFPDKVGASHHSNYRLDRSLANLPLHQ